MDVVETPIDKLVPYARKPIQIVGSQAATRLILPDLSLLRDTDDTGGSGSRLYYLMGGYGTPGWPGASLYRSADGSAWAQVGRGLAELLPVIEAVMVAKLNEQMAANGGSGVSP